MWFKNIQLYRLVSPFTTTPDELDEMLRSRTFVRCGSMDMMTSGWVPPLAAVPERLVYSANGRSLIKLCVEEKLLPASVVRQLADEKIAEIEEQQGFKLGRKRRLEIREQVTDELLPRAFTRTRTTTGYIDSEAGWLIVDAASPKKAEDFTEALRRCTGSLDIRPVQTGLGPSAAMTEWLRERFAPAGFTVDMDCELASPGDEGAVVRCIRQDLGSDEIKSHIENGKQAVKLGMTWSDRISFVVTEDLQIKRLDFLDVLRDRSAEAAAETAEQQYAADFAIMTGEFVQFIPDLIDAFGGEQRPQ